MSAALLDAGTTNDFRCGVAAPARMIPVARRNVNSRCPAAPRTAESLYGLSKKWRTHLTPGPGDRSISMRRSVTSSVLYFGTGKLPGPSLKPRTLKTNAPCDQPGLSHRATRKSALRLNNPRPSAGALAPRCSCDAWFLTSTYE